MVVGVDGCTNGWVAIALERGETAGDLFPDIAALAAHHNQASLILIDVHRRPDRPARRRA
jgi:predicted RNase H-like nuclease